MTSDPAQRNLGPPMDQPIKPEDLAAELVKASADPSKAAEVAVLRILLAAANAGHDVMTR